MDKKEKEESFCKARNIVFRLLKFRFHSEEEVRKKLTAKNLPDSVIKQTIQYFKDLGLIDDRRFAQQWISSRLKKPFGINRIRLELKKKGIDSLIIQETLKEATKHYEESEVVTTLARYWASKYKNIAPEKIRQRVYGYLLRRGFNINTIIQVIKSI